jgi:Zn-dependent M28 family amino/carboxypeptidase
MYGIQAILTFLAAAALAAGADFSGQSALEYTRRVVAFGQRTPGSPAMHRQQAYLRAELAKRGCQVWDDTFTASTPLGPIRMSNIIARFPGRSTQAIVFTGHYDTKVMPGINFVGANDGGASTGFLLEMARVLAGQSRQHDVYLVWFDGEEAIAQWSETDGVYGSRHLAARWNADGTLGRIKALINVDMIGDRDLGILREGYSSPGLRARVWSAARRRGYGSHFLNEGSLVEDDHAAFVRLGVNALNLIDFGYGPSNSYWHTEKDTIDKLSADSFQVVGTVLLDVLRELEQ